jgi:hypothetical protein
VRLTSFQRFIKNLPNSKILSKVALVSPILNLPLEEEEDLKLNYDLKLKNFNPLLCNLKGEINSTSDDIFIHYRDKRQIKEIFVIAKDILGIFLGTFAAEFFLQFCSTMNQFNCTQNILRHVTAKNQNEIRAI